MRKKNVCQKPPRERIYKLPEKPKPSTHSQDRTFTPSPSSPTSPPHSDPMARTKNPSRVPPSAKQTPPLKEHPSKPGSSKPSSSKGKHLAATEPTSKPSQPKTRSVSLHSQRGKPQLPLKSVKEPDIGPFDYKSHFLTSHSNYNPYRFKSAMNNDFFEGVIKYRPLCPSFLADLPNLKKKGFSFVENLEFLDWNHLFNIKKPVYPLLVKHFYANMTYHEGSVHSYVKGRDIVLNDGTISDSLKYTDVGPCAYTSVKWDEGVDISFSDALAHICEHISLIDGITPTHKTLGYERAQLHCIGGGSVKQHKGPTRTKRVVLDDEDDEFIPEESPPPSTEDTSISTGQKSALFNIVKDVVQEFVSQSNHMISMSKEQRKLASKHENFLRKSRDRVAVFMKFIDNLQQDEDHAIDAEEEADSEKNGSDA
ncbi:uncharacterized protein DS421_17g594640 [Arachis hypogaea]|nr:uncharacterized protein DS421_17g594640 [Arachis hypogaea]